MTKFIVDYISSLTGFAFERSVIERIALERGVDYVDNIAQISVKQKDLILADLLYVAYYSPSITPSISKKHGTYSVSVGSQHITNRDELWRMMHRLYSKWDEEKLDEDSFGNLKWME